MKKRWEARKKSKRKIQPRKTRKDKLKERNPRGFIILVNVIDLTFGEGVPGGSQSFFFNKRIFKPFPESKSTPIVLLSRFPYSSSILRIYLREQNVLCLPGVRGL